MCSTVRSWTRSSGPRSARLAGRTSLSASSSSKSWKNAWGGGGFCRRGALFWSWCPSSPALAIFGRCGATSRPGPSRRSSARVSAMNEPSLAPPPRGAVACRRRLPPSHSHVQDPSQTGAWGSWAPPCTNVMLIAVSSVRTRESAGAWVAIPQRKATLDGQSPQSNPKAAHRSDLSRCPCRHLADSQLRQVSLKDQDLTGH